MFAALIYATVICGCGTLQTRFGNVPVGAYPYDAVTMTVTDDWPSVLDSTTDHKAVLFGVLLVSFPLDVCIDTVLLPGDLVAWSFGTHKDGFLGICRDKITFTVRKDRVLSVAEFRTRFAESNLNSECYWYFGNKNGYAYVEMDESRPIDEHDDAAHRRVHHTLSRYRVAEADVEFIPKVAFTGYDHGKRIVEFRNAGGDWSAVYRIINP